MPVSGEGWPGCPTAGGVTGTSVEDDRLEPGTGWPVVPAAGAACAKSKSSGLVMLDGT